MCKGQSLGADVYFGEVEYVAQLFIEVRQVVLRRALQKARRDDNAIDLISSFVNSCDPGVTIGAFSRIIL